MGFLDRFRRTPKAQPQIDPLADLVLEKLRIGYLVDYDLHTWEVTDYSRFKFNDGRSAEEWELSQSRESIYLERSVGEGELWSISKSIPIGALGNARSHILKHEDPPEQIEHQGTLYYLEGSVGGEMTASEGSDRHELIVWEFVDDTDEKFLSIQQWSETEITASVGHAVEDYQFTNILPGNS